MTPPVRPEPHPAEYLQFLRASDPARAALFEEYLTETGQAHHIGTATRQEEFASGRLAKRHARENTNDAEALALAEEEKALDTPLNRGLAGVTALAKDIPGAEAAQAGVRSLTRGVPYREALGDVRGSYEAIAPAARIPLRIAGGATAGAALPIASPAKAGAAYGGLLNALSADPDQSLGERTLKTGVGAAVGGALGKAGDMVATGVRAKFAKPLGASLDDLTAARTKASAPLYDKALAEGAMAPATPEVAAFLARPDVDGIVAGLQQLDEFRGLAPEDPRILDAIYKVLSDQQKTIGKQLMVADPGRPNLGRFTERQIRGTKGVALDAMDATMPSYRSAVQEFARGSAAIEGLKRGSKAAAIESGGGQSLEHLSKFGRTSLLDFLEGQGPEVSEQAAQGVLGFGRRKLEQAGPTGLLNPMRGMARNFLTEGGGLLRAIEGTAGTNAAKPLTPQTLLDFLLRAEASAGTPNMGRY